MKARRQLRIMEIIASRVISTQEELVEALRQEGFEVTQATISRDIKELRLIKVPLDAQSYRYALPQDQPTGDWNERLRRVFRDMVISIKDSENLILVRTVTGHAHAVAAALDHTDWPEVIGTVAGDDTILIIVKPKEKVSAVMERLEGLLV